MKCPYCGEEMIRGYLMSSRDITFAVDNVTKVFRIKKSDDLDLSKGCLLYTSPSPRDSTSSRMPSSA